MRRVLIFASALLLVGALSVSFGVSSAKADFIQNAGFENLEQYNGTSWVPYAPTAASTTLANSAIIGYTPSVGDIREAFWSAANANAISHSNGGFMAPEGDMSIQLGDQNGVALQQPILTPGEYVLTFLTAKSSDVNTVLSVTFDGLPSQNFAVNKLASFTSADWELHQLVTTIHSTSNYTVQFNGISGQPLVDVVGVQRTPEPSSMALMGLGLAVVGGLSRRRRKQSKA